MFLLVFSAVFASTAMLCTSVRVVDASTRLPRLSAPPMHQFSGPIGELHSFGLFLRYADGL